MNVVFYCQHCNAVMQASSDALGMDCICVSCNKQTKIQQARSSSNNKEASQNSHDDNKLAVACPTCTRILEYQRQLVGTRGLCRGCHEVFILPSPGENVVAEPRLPNAIAFECTACHQLFEGKTEQIGKKARCVHCKTVFTIAALAADDKPKAKSASAKKPITSPSKKQASLPTSASAPSPKPTRPSSTPAPAQPAAPIIASPVFEEPVVAYVAQPANENFYDWNSPQASFGPPAYTPPNHFNPYATSPSFAPTYSAPGASVRLTLAEIFKHTFDHLSPGIFYLYLPMLFMTLIIFGSLGALYFSNVYILKPIAETSGATASVLAIIALCLFVAANVLAVLAFVPGTYVIGNYAVRGRELSADLAVPSGEVRVRFVLLMLVQILVNSIVSGSLFIFLTVVTGVIGIFAAPFNLLAVVITVSLTSIFMISGAATAHKLGPVDGLNAGFKIFFNNFGVMLGLLAIETLVAIPLTILILPAIFFMPQYMILRSATIYYLASGRR